MTNQTKRPKSAITSVPGFRAVGVSCGIKQSGDPDLALVVAEHDCAAAALFTQNQFKAAPVQYDIVLLERTQTLRGVLINAGNANALTGVTGTKNTIRMAQITELLCELPHDSIFVMSTGVIGQYLPMEKIEAGIKQARQAIKTEAGLHGEQVAHAIMTTDLVPKEAFIETTIAGETVRLGGMAKGSGMIEPNMATMLALVTTDTNISPVALKLALQQAAAVSFHAITVDGESSTNDTLLAMATGQANHAPIEGPDSPGFVPFTEALSELCITLAKAIARDGEGATKLLEITVRGAVNQQEARQAAKAIANSPLVKTAMFGNDPNWGRILAAVGYSGSTVKPQKINLTMGDFQLVQRGEPLKFNRSEVAHWLKQVDELPITVDLGVGTGEATVWTCDYSYDYIKINAEYHT